MTPLPLTSLPVTWQLTALSLGVAVVLACGLSLLAAWLLRHRPVPVQYGLLLSALVLCLAAPLLTQIARVSGLGRVQVNLPVAPLPVARPEPVSAEPSVTSPAIVPAMATTTGTGNDSATAVHVFVAAGWRMCCDSLGAGNRRGERRRGHARRIILGILRRQVLFHARDAEGQPPQGNAGP